MELLEIRPVGAKLLHVDNRKKERHEETKLKVALHNVANAPNKRRTSMSSAGFQPPVPANKRLQICASDRAATGIRYFNRLKHEIHSNNVFRNNFSS